MATYEIDLSCHVTRTITIEDACSEDSAIEQAVEQMLDSLDANDVDVDAAVCVDGTDEEEEEDEESEEEEI